MTTVLLAVLLAGAPASQPGVSPVAAFEKLKELAGTWEGHVTTPDGPEATVEFRLTSGGKTVMEFQFPDSDYEMVSVYFLDGDELVAKHYCAMGNQPEMKLDPQASSATELVFMFTGGTNLDPAKDYHVHGGKMSIGDNRLENEWDVYNGKTKETANRFFLTRVK
jgi:hypothetical protein